MPEKYTKAALSSIELAKHFSAELKQNYTGSEHLLMGLLREEGGLASKVLLMNKVTLKNIMNLTEQLVAPGSSDMDTSVAEREGLTPRAQRIISLAHEIAA